jgi:hypothetical protein
MSGEMLGGGVRPYYWQYYLRTRLDLIIRAFLGDSGMGSLGRRHDNRDPSRPRVTCSGRTARSWSDTHVPRSLTPAG